MSFCDAELACGDAWNEALFMRATPEEFVTLARPWHSSDGEEGQALIEFAVSLPILLLLVTGILTFGLALNNYVILNNATDTGARALAISRGQTTDPCATTVAAVYAAAPLLRAANFTFSFALNGAKFSGTSCNSAAAQADMVQGASAQVTVTYPCSLAVFGVNYAPGCTLQAQTTELIQ